MMLCELEQERTGRLDLPVIRYRAGQREAEVDVVAEEVPVAIVINGISHAVMMATPRDLDAFAVGFALTEGLVAARRDIHDLEIRDHCTGIEVELTISQQTFQRLKERRRSLAGRSGCGVCGIESLALLDLAPLRVRESRLPVDLPLAVLNAGAGLAAHQHLMKATGGVHAAAWCNLEGALHAVFEDIGRHNALDKLLGHQALRNADLRNGFVFMSSRASYELVRKAARLDVPMLATISAPSSLAIDIACQAGMKLVSFCRHDGFVEYT